MCFLVIRQKKTCSFFVSLFKELNEYWYSSSSSIIENAFTYHITWALALFKHAYFLFKFLFIVRYWLDVPLIYSFISSYMCPDQGLNPQRWRTGMTLWPTEHPARAKYTYFLKKILFVERGAGRERGREISICETSIGCLSRPQPGAWPATQACALTSNWTGDFLVCGTTPNRLSNTSQGQTCIYLNVVPTFVNVWELWQTENPLHLLLSLPLNNQCIY